jgi:hypothetical protein
VVNDALPLRVYLTAVEVGYVLRGSPVPATGEWMSCLSLQDASSAAADR